MNKLKQLKREEILEKLKKAEFLSGNKIGDDKRLLEKVEKELKTEFIPELYDRAMEKMFDEHYYEVEDATDRKAVKQKHLDLQLMNDEEIGEENQEDEVEEGQEDEPVQEKYEKEISKSIRKQIKQREDDEVLEGGYQTWFVCDGC